MSSDLNISLTRLSSLHLHRRVASSFVLSEPVQELEHACLGRPLQTRVVHVLQPEPHIRSLTPLKVFKNKSTLSIIKHIQETLRDSIWPESVAPAQVSAVFCLVCLTT